MKKALAALFVPVVIAVSFCSCSGIDAGGTDPEPFFGHSDARCAKIGEYLYICDGYYSGLSRLVYVHLGDEGAYPLCAKPNCLHNDGECTAFQPSFPNSICAYGGKLLTVEHDEGRPVLYERSADGSAKKRIMSIDPELYMETSDSPPAVYSGTAYFCGSELTVNDGALAYETVVFKQKLGSNAGREIYRSRGGEVTSCGTLYEPGSDRPPLFCFAETGRFEDSPEEETLRIFEYDTGTGELAMLYCGATDVGYRSIYAYDGYIYLCGYGTAARCSADSGEFEILISSAEAYGNGLAVGLGEGQVMCWPEKDRWVVCGFDGKELYGGLFEADGLADGMFARECVGWSDGCFYWFLMSLTKTEERSYLVRFDTVAMTYDVLWNG